MKYIICIIVLIFSVSVYSQQDSLKVDTSRVYTPDTQHASYNGGIREFHNYIIQNFNFDNIDSNDYDYQKYKSDTILIYVEFTVNKNGFPDDIQSSNTSVNSSIFKELKRVISSSRWKPSSVDGVPTDQKVAIPILITIVE